MEQWFSSADRSLLTVARPCGNLTRFSFHSLWGRAPRTLPALTRGVRDRQCHDPRRVKSGASGRRKCAPRSRVCSALATSHVTQPPSEADIRDVARRGRTSTRCDTRTGVHVDAGRRELRLRVAPGFLAPARKAPASRQFSQNVRPQNQSTQTSFRQAAAQTGLLSRASTRRAWAWMNAARRAEDEGT